jgi:2-succinyl-5-enolpyruvyl-6-hydroxy-3-cyclohexene-1-carboxylate synthase
VLAGFIARAVAAGAEVTALDGDPAWRDPDRLVRTRHVADPGSWLTAARTAARTAAPRRPDGSWPARWEAVERAAQTTLDRLLGPGASADARLSEPAVARLVPTAVPRGTTVVVASSMPVRDLEWFAPPCSEPPRVLANRGVNGIDGITSTTLGVAAAGTGPAVGLLGDLAFLHDVSALVHAGGTASAGSPCALVVVDNGGGGIFSFLPQARAVDAARFEQLFGTPQVPAVTEVAAGFGLPVRTVHRADELRSALAGALTGDGGNGGATVIRVAVPDRAANVAVHDEVHAAVGDAALAALGP